MRRLTFVLTIAGALSTRPCSAVYHAHYTAPVAGLAWLQECADSGAVHEPLRVELWAARAMQGTAWSRTLLRSHTVAPGARDSFELYDSAPYTYWTSTCNSVACSCFDLPGSSLTVGVPSVGVQPTDPSATPGTWFDVAGRIVRPPLAAGVWFYRAPGTASVKRIVVLK